MTTTDSGIVPVKALKNALIVKSREQYYKNQLKVVQDSVAVALEIVKYQSNLINNLETKVDILSNNDSLYVEIRKVNKKQLEETTSRLNLVTKQLKFAKVAVAILLGTTGTLLIIN